MHSRIAMTLCCAFAIVTASGCAKSKSGKRYEDYPEFKTGGSMTLTIDGMPYTIALDEIFFNNTDAGYPDFAEINGGGTRIVVPYTPKDIKFDSDAAYNRILNVPLSIKKLDHDEKDMTLNVPNLGAFKVTGGTLTVQKGLIGRDGHDWWDGQIALNLDGPNGPKTASGTFAWCIIPVW